MKKEKIYIGTWAAEYDGTAGGTLLYAERAKLGESFEMTDEYQTGSSVSCMCADEKKRLLFVPLEVRQEEEKAGGIILSYQVQSDGTLSEIGSIPSLGAYPIAMILTERYAVVLNHGSTTNKVVRTVREAAGRFAAEFIYDEGNLVLFLRNQDGTIGAAKDIYTFTGSGEIPFFQESAAPHSLLYLSEENEIHVPCRGNDEIVIIQIDHEHHKLKKTGAIKTARGYGPRNAVYSRAHNCLYLMHEIEPIIKAYRRTIDGFQEIQEVKTVTEEICQQYPAPADSFEALHPVDILIHPKQPLLYVLTRTSNTVTTYEIKGGGDLELSDCRTFGGENPRQLICRSDQLYIVSMDTGELVQMCIDEDSGIPQYQRTSLIQIPRIAAAYFWRNEGNDEKNI